jgi:hypothetical protein
MRNEPPQRRPSTKQSVAAVLFASGLVASAATAAAPDPLWEKTVATMKASRKWVAQDLEDTVNAVKDNERRRVVQKKQLAGWDEGVPRYTVVSTTSGKSGSKDEQQVDFALLGRLGDEDLLEPGTSLKRTDDQVLDGKSVSVFQGQLKSGLKVKLWVDAETGALLQRVDEVSIPFGVESLQTTRFVIDPEGRNLPSSATINLTVNVPFKKVRVDIATRMSNWVEAKR